MNNLRIRGCRLVVALLSTLTLAGPVQAIGPGVSGRVLALDEKGVPLGSVAGAKIEFKNRAGKVIASVTADKRGAYKANLPAGTYFYKVQAAGFKDEDSARGLTLTLSEGYAVHNFSLSRGKTDPKLKKPGVTPGTDGNLTGRVLEKNAEGKLVGIPGARIALRKAGDKQLTQVVARADDPKENGNYATALGTGAYQASVTAVGFETFVAPNPLEIAGGKPATRDFVLTRLGSLAPSGQGIKGMITLADAKSLAAKVKVSIRALPQVGDPGTPLNPDDKGSYQRDLRPGRYQVVAEAPGFQTATSEPREVFAGKYTVVNLRLLSSAKDLLFVATVYERLPGDGGRKPLAGANVVVRKLGDPLTGAPQGTTSADGKVSLKVAGPGKYQALARMKGYKLAGVQTEIRTTGDNHAELELLKEVSLATLRLRVVEGKDSPLAEAKVVISQDGRVLKTGMSDSKGGLSQTLPPGSYRIDVTKLGYKPAAIQVSLAAKDLQQDILLTRPLAAKAMLHVYVVERLKAGDKAVAGAEVVVAQKDKRVVTDKTGMDGRLAVPLSAGAYTVFVLKPGYKTVSVPVVVAAKDIPQEIVLTRTLTAKPMLNLRVFEKLKTVEKMIAGAEIVISQKDKRILSDKTGMDGKLAVPLAAGTYTVVVTKLGYKTATVQVIIAAQDVSQDIPLTRAPAKKEGTAPVKLESSDLNRLPPRTQADGISYNLTNTARTPARPALSVARLTALTVFERLARTHSWRTGSDPTPVANSAKVTSDRRYN